MNSSENTTHLQQQSTEAEMKSRSKRTTRFLIVIGITIFLILVILITLLIVLLPTNSIGSKLVLNFKKQNFKDEFCNLKAKTISTTVTLSTGTSKKREIRNSELPGCGNLTSVCQDKQDLTNCDQVGIINLINCIAKNTVSPLINI